jgi:uncharacterized protein with PIN domain
MFRRRRPPRRRPGRGRDKETETKDEEKKPPDNGPKLTCDAMLGKLAKELRILGVNVEYNRGAGGMNCYRKARGDGRTMITRNTRLKELPGVFFIQGGRTEEELAQVKKEFNIRADSGQALTRCLEDNEELEKVTREQARPSIPFFIYQIHHEFRRCPKCKRVYWPGSHVRDMQRRVESGRGQGGRGRPRRGRSRPAN